MGGLGYSSRATKVISSIKTNHALVIEKYEKPSGPGEKYLDWLAKNNYAPAFFYLVLQDENHKRSPEECVQLLQKAYKGNPLFYPELLYYEFRKNKILQSGAFTPQKTLLYRDDPLYTLLSFYRKNPDFPRLKESLLASQRCPEFAEWKKIKSPEADLVRGLSIMVQEQYKRIHSSSSVKLQEAFSCLERAALKKNPVALYWIGRAYYYNDLPPALQKQNTNHESRVWKARIFLQEAEKSGNQNASLLLAEIELNQPTTNLIRILSITDAFCKLKLPLAFELKTQVLRRLGRNAEANRISREGIEAGSYRLYRDLALSEKQKKKSAIANQYWFKFIQGDRISRMEDIEDFFWSDPYREFSQGHDDQKNNIRYNQKNQIREP